MLPSSSSQLARYGSLNHYKKFWLLQTQLEKQEQSSSSSTLSLSSASAASAAPPSSGHAIIKESSKTSSLPAHNLNGDAHHAIVGPQYGICRMEMSASSSSGRVINSSPSLTYCPGEPTCVRDYFSHMPGYCLQPNDVSLSRVETQSSPLSLAVNCGDVATIKSANCTWQVNSPQLDSNDHQQQMLGRLSAQEPAASCESLVNEVDKGVYDGSTPRISSVASDHLTTGGQGHLISESQHRDPVSSRNNSPVSGVTTSIGYLRTCTLCGTTRTPLWRSGPEGPKSLCNACGIRVKKTRRLEASLQVTNGSSLSPSTISGFKGALKRKLSSDKLKDFTLHKKRRSTAVVSGPNFCRQKVSRYSRKPGGLWDNGLPKLATLLSHNGRSPTNDFAEDVEEAAVLLMALSCGLVLS
ncbi:hypothetical protein L7F22_047750 [Adiantum nelumboides]|nr:hypothetical protein [Adiantum nelumboides]